MAGLTPPNPNPNSYSPPPLPPALPAPPPPPERQADGDGASGGGRGFLNFPRPALRVTSEFDSETAAWFHKVSCRLFDRLAKLKLTFQNDLRGEISIPQLGVFTKHLSVLYDLESRNALLSGAFDAAGFLQLRATHDVKVMFQNAQIGEPNYVQIGCPRKPLSFSCTCERNKSIISCIKLDKVFLFKYHYRKEQQGAVTLVANLADPLYKFEFASAVPFHGLPKATLYFPAGDVSAEEKENEQAQRVLSLNGILRGQILNGVCTALYKENNLNLRYCYKDKEMSFIPSISMPSNAVSFAFKRRFSSSDKLSYWYHFDSNEWNAVYKHTMGKDLKFKAGYDSEVQLGWASLWVGDEEGKTKIAPKKVKVQFMLQVPRDDVGNSVFMFRVKKRWDI